VEGISVHSVPMERDPSPLRDLVALLRWMEILRITKPDVVTAGTPKAALLAAVSGWILRVPDRIYLLRGLRLETASGMLYRVLTRLERLTFALSTRSIAVSESLRDEAVRLGLTHGRTVAVLGRGSSNGVDTSRFFPRADDDIEVLALRDRIGLASGLPTIGYVGRLTADKGLGLLDAALDLLAAKGFAVQLLVVGGVDGARLPRPSRPSPVRTFSTGRVPDTSAYYALMDVLCLPTRREGFPNVVLEAGAAGVPTVTTNATGAIDSVVDGKTGLIVDKDDASQLAEALEALLTDSDRRRRLGQHARQWVVAEFERTTVWERMEAYLAGGLSGTCRPHAESAKGRAS